MEEIRNRPTVNALKQIVSGIDKKISETGVALNKQMERLDRAMDILDTEVKSYDEQFREIRMEFGTKLDRQEGKKIWESLQRFAEYSDLKELYSKCIP